nr:TOBE domain-containing protein [Rhabdothermincola salaria]
MDEGRIAQIGSPAEVWTRPATASVARFLGFANVDDDHLVRPDAVELTALPDQAAPAVGGVEARAPGGPTPVAGERGVGVVEAVVFTGARAEVRVRLTDGSVLEASVATGAVLAPGGPGLPRVGERVGVAVDPSGVVAFP